MHHKFLLFIFLVFPFFSYSQNACTDLTISVNAPGLVVSCEDYVLIFHIHNASTTTAYSNVGLAIKFEMDSAVITTPTGTLNGNYRTYFSSTIDTGATVNDTIRFRYDCHSISQNNQLLLPIPASGMTDSVMVFIPGNQPCLSNAFLHSYTLGSPYLESNFESSLSVRGWTFASRSFNLINRGSSSYFDNYFAFSDTLNSIGSSFIHILNAKVYVNSNLLSVIPATDTASISFSFDSIAMHIITGDTLKIVENFEILGCPVSPAESQIKYEWGCSRSETCISITQAILVSFEGVEETSNVFFTRLLPGDSTAQYWDNSCTGDITHWRFLIENRDNINFRNVHLYFSVTQGSIPFYTYILNDSLHPILLGQPVSFDSVSYLRDQFTDSLPHCLNDNINAIFYADIFLDTLWSGFRDTLSFYTLRCCPDDENIDSTSNIDEYDLFNKTLSFNHWNLFLKGITACNDSLTLISKPAGASLYGTSSLSTNNGNGDLHLSQDFFSTVSDMYVPHGQPAGTSRVCCTECRV
ncbi:MAG: hypothetical protein IPP99_00110 [Chitinophagaceae bacterium]|nr:hypothetical protein [Chitinophagaceae bacterium]